MKKFTKEQKFLYTRITILVASIGWIAAAYAGFKGFPYWYGGFVLCFFIAFGLLNLQQKSPMWFAVKRPALFSFFYLVLVASAFLADQLGLRLFLWIYPAYHGLGFLWIYFVLYPFGGLAVLELLYFLSGHLGEPLAFAATRDGKWHRSFDVAESLLFLLMTGLIVLGATGQAVPVPLVATAVLLWMASAVVKLRLHVRHGGHYLLALVITALFAVMLHEFPNTIAREWVYLPAQGLDPVVSQAILGVPFWVWIGYFFLTLVPLRLWIFLVLHPKVR